MRKQQPKTPEEIFDANRGLVYHIARRIKVPEEERDDMIQEGLLALWRAFQGFNPDAGFKFSTYAGTAITRSMTAYAEKSWHRNHFSSDPATQKRAYKAALGKEPMRPGYERLLQDFVSLDMTAFNNDSETTIADMFAEEDDYSPIYNSMIRDDIEVAVMLLPPREREAVARYWGFLGHEPSTIETVARAVGCSRETVRNRLLHASELLAESLADYRGFIDS